jgi:hypothetical protein
MKLKFPRLLPALLALLTVFLLCCGCTPDAPPDTPPDDPNDQEQEEVPMLELIKGGATSYAVIRPEDCDATVKSAASSLLRALKTISGTKDIDIKTDYEAPTDYEILVGNTTRPESSEVASRLGENDYRIEIVGKKLVVVGKTVAGKGVILK